MPLLVLSFELRLFSCGIVLCRDARSRLTFRAQARRTNTVAERSWREGCARSRSDSEAKYCDARRRCLQRFVRPHHRLFDVRATPSGADPVLQSDAARPEAP